MARVRTGLDANVVVNRVWTGTDTEVAPAGSVADAGGVTMFWLPAVPPALRLTVIGLDEAADALIDEGGGRAFGDLAGHRLDGEDHRGDVGHVRLERGRVRPRRARPSDRRRSSGPGVGR